MKILQVFPRFPWPLKDGGAVAFYASLSGLNKHGVDITAAILNTSKHRITFKALPPEVKELAAFHLYDINNDITPGGALKNLLQKQSYIISRFYDRGFEELLVRLIKETPFDVILFESLQTAVYIDAVKQHTQAPCVYRAHNVEHHIWQGQALVEKNLFKRAYLRLQAAKLARFEREVICKFDALLPITRADALSFTAYGVTQPMLVMPAGLELDRFSMYTPDNEGPVFHIGSMDWMPNQEAVNWFLREAWPLVLKRVPGARFSIAGRNMPAAFQSIKQPGVTVIGEVDNAYAFMQQQGIMVVPLHSGSGMRIKVIEGMAMGKCIVATTTGMEGVFAEPGRHYQPANTAREFADAIVLLLGDMERARQTGQAAREFVFAKYNNRQIIDAVAVFLEQLVDTRRRAQNKK